MFLFHSIILFDARQILLVPIFNMSLTDLLCDEENTLRTAPADYLIDDNYIMELFRESNAENKRRILRYFELLESCNEINDSRPAKRGSVMYQLFRTLKGITL